MGPAAGFVANISFDICVCFMSDEAAVSTAGGGGGSAGATPPTPPAASRPGPARTSHPTTSLVRGVERGGDKFEPQGKQVLSKQEQNDLKTKF